MRFPAAYVIILNWNGYRDTVECVSSLKADGLDESSVIIVDNGSDNDEGPRLKERFPDIQLIQNKTNRGFSGGNNDGISWALKNGAEYIAFLNNDCTVEKGWLRELLEALESSGCAFAASRIMFYRDRDVICTDEDAIYPDGSGVPVNRYKRYRTGGAPRPVKSACAAAALFSVKALKDARISRGQYFDELYFAYNEDIDLAVRVGARGYKGVSVPGAVVYHKHSRTSGKYSFFKMFHSEKNRIMNEILCFPIYFFPVGETFYFVKTFWAFTAGIFGKGAKAERYAGEAGVFSVVRALVKARIWVIKNLSGIIRDRVERKKRGLITKKVFKDLFWDLNVFAK